MYTFYFKVCPAGLSAKVKYKLIALKGLHTPIEPELGKRYGREALSGLVANGHKVIIQPARPSSAPHPDFCKGLGDTAVPTMRYAKGYGPAPAKSSDTVGYAQKLAELKPESTILTAVEWGPLETYPIKSTIQGSDGDFHKVETTPEIAALMEDTKKSLQKMAKDPAFVKGLTDAGYKINWENWDSVSAVAAEKVCQYLGDQEVKNATVAKSVHFTDYGCRLTRWERIKAWFHRNFTP